MTKWAGVFTPQASVDVATRTCTATEKYEEKHHHGEIRGEAPQWRNTERSTTMAKQESLGIRRPASVMPSFQVQWKKRESCPQHPQASPDSISPFSPPLDPRPQRAAQLSTSCTPHHRYPPSLPLTQKGFPRRTWILLSTYSCSTSCLSPSFSPAWCSPIPNCSVCRRLESCGAGRGAGTHAGGWVGERKRICLGQDSR
jgi:hypothetical protein